MAGIPKFNAMTLRKVRDLGWNPIYIIATVGSSVSSGLAPAGLDKAVGLVTGAYMKDPSDPQWKTDPAYQDWLAFIQKYQPDADLADINNVYGYCAAQTGIQVFKQCGNDLSRQNIMHQAASLDIQLPMFQGRHPLHDHRHRLPGDQTVAAATVRRQGLGAVRRPDRGVAATAGCVRLPRGLEQCRDRILRLPLHPMQMVLAEETLGIDLLHVFGAGTAWRRTTRSSPPP